MLFSNEYNYRELLRYELEQIFSFNNLNVDFLMEYSSLKEELEYVNEKKLLK